MPECMRERMSGYVQDRVPEYLPERTPRWNAGRMYARKDVRVYARKNVIDILAKIQNLCQIEANLSQTESGKNVSKMKYQSICQYMPDGMPDSVSECKTCSR